MDIKNVYALVTGASTGIGAEYAKLLASEGYNIILVSRNKSLLDEVAKNIKNNHNVDVHVFPQDLSNLDAAKNIYEYTSSNDLKVEILINNAGYGDVGKFLEHNLNEHTAMLHSMLQVIVELTHYYMPEMMNRNSGYIINVSSVVGLMGTSLKMKVTRALYRPIKCFVIAFSEQLKVAYGDTNIKVQCLCPGLTVSNFHKRVGQEDLYDKIPSLFWLTSAEVASLSYNALKTKNNVVFVTGFINKIGILFHRISSVFLWR
jgi:short-subunit dehydrogenase